MVDALNHMPMVKKLSFTKFKSSLFESLKDYVSMIPSFAEIWWIVHVGNKQMQLSCPLSKTRVSLERLSKLSIGR